MTLRTISRAAGIVSRRFGRPELLAAIDRDVLRGQRELLAIRVALTSWLRSSSMYVDVGVNRGQFLADAIRIAPGGSHLAFEPIPHLASAVSRRWPQVDCRALALGAVPGEAEFCHFTKMDGWSGLRRQPEVSTHRGGPELIRVTVSTLDSEIGDARPTVVKIDVEGGEFDVLRGGMRVLSELRPVVVFEHERGPAGLYGTPPQEPWDLLTSLDYRIFAITGEGPFSRYQFAQASDVVNWLATPA